MARARRNSRSVFEKFALDYRHHRMERKAIREWTSARLRRRSPPKLRQWVDEEEHEVTKALVEFRSMVGKAKVARAIANAEEHRDWLRLIRGEINRQAPAGWKAPNRRPSRIRVGLLAREAQAHQAKKGSKPK